MAETTGKSRKPKPKAKTETALATIPAIKGFNRDLTCRGFQFEPGKTYEQAGTIRACSNGFHSCPIDGDTSPLSVFEYYAPGVSRYFEVTASGAADREGNKIASASITIGVEIGVGELVGRFIDWVMARAKPTGAASNSGARGAASNSGYGGAASNSGARGAASNSGDYGAASNSGARGAAFSHAYAGKVMCEGEGQALYCTEFDDDILEIVSVACGITGRDGIRAGVWYACRDGKLVAA
jgi:hypothetical protein